MLSYMLILKDRSNLPCHSYLGVSAFSPLSVFRMATYPPTRFCFIVVWLNVWPGNLMLNDGL